MQPKWNSVEEFLTSQKNTPDDKKWSSVDEFLQAQNKPHATVTQPFGNVNPEIERFMQGGVNTGTDFDYKSGTPIALPPGQWQVEEAYGEDTQPGYIGNASNKGYGNSVYAKNLQTGETIRLSHLSSVDVKPGQIVNGGYVGKTGETGNVTGPHADIQYTDKSGKLSDITKTPYSY